MINGNKKAQSIVILNRYRNEISKELYEQILWVIGNQAIEDMFLIEDDIKALIALGRGDITADKLISGYKRKWGVV